MYPTPVTDDVNRCGRLAQAKANLIDIATLHKLYLQSVFAYVSRRISNTTDAEDITAEVFVAAAVELPKYRHTGGYYAWLAGIARRKMVDADRRRRRQPELLDSDLTEAERETLGLLLTTDIGHLPEEVIQHEESQRVMRQLIADLPAMQREALLLQVVDELPIKEIAEVMGRSLEAINSLLQRARAGIFRNGKGYFRG